MSDKGQKNKNGNNNLVELLNGKTIELQKIFPIVISNSIRLIRNKVSMHVSSKIFKAFRND